MGPSNYIGCAGYLGAAETTYTGPYYMNSKTKIADITDGTSNTLGFGETLGGQAPPAIRDFRLTWMGSGSMPTAWGLQESPGWYEFSSKHTGVVQFAFCDGSVHGMTRAGNSGTAYNNFIYASGMHDGRVVDFTQLGQ
jgi:prepilin-type processing-associated H-X9-DG protein